MDDKIAVTITLNETESARWLADAEYRDELKELARGICRASGRAVETKAHDGTRLTKTYVDLVQALEDAVITPRPPG